MPQPSILFAPAFTLPAQALLRQRLQMLAATGTFRPICVDTLFARIDADTTPSPATRTWQVLFDLHRVLLYDQPAAPAAPGLNAVVRFVTDGYDFNRLDLLQAHFGQHPYTFLYPPGSLDLLPWIWQQDRPGHLFVLDLRQAEVRVCTVILHPEALPVPDATPPTPPSPAPRLRRRFVDTSLRIPVRADVAGLVSPDAGVIRAEELQQNPLSYLVSMTRLAWNRGREEDFCGGRAFNRADATFTGRCEAIERFHILFHPPDAPLVSGTYAALSAQALDPAALFYHRHHPFPQPERFPAYAPDRTMYWTWAFAPADGTPRLIPAQEVWFNTERLPGEQAVIRTTSNGTALGGCFEEALLFALLEAVERDCYLSAWVLRRPCTPIDPASVRAPAFQLLREKIRYIHPNYDLYFLDITNDLGIPAVWALGVRRDGTGAKTLHGAAARLTLEGAMVSALQEMSAFFTFNKVFASRQEHFSRLLERPDRIHNADDHRGYYGMDAAFAHFDFLQLNARQAHPAPALMEQALLPPRRRYNLRQVLEQVLAHLRAQDVDVVARDITHPAFLQRHLHCVKVVATQLLPVYYGHYHLRLSLTERLRRLGRAWHGVAPDRVEDLNLAVHPFS